MFHRVGRMTGINLPLATLFAAPTVRTLAQAYHAAGAPMPATTQAKRAPADPWAPLVPMRTGSRPSPLFFIHAVGGNVLNYRPLAAEMPADMPVYGLQALGLDGRTPPLTRIEDMAKRYVQEIRSVQPTGPYHLAGGSMGGMIAYEMAQQLVAAGEQVAMLGLIDTSSRYGSRVRDEARQRPSRWRKIRQRLQGLSAIEVVQAIAAMLRARRQAAIARRRVEALRRRGEELPHDLRYGDIEAAHFRAYRDYVVTPYAGKLTLFRAEQQRAGRAVDATLGWDALVGDLDVFSIPGDHDVIVEAPELARSLREAIEAAHVPPTAEQGDRRTADRHPDRANMLQGEGGRVVNTVA